MFTVKRLHKLTDYKESSPEGLSKIMVNLVLVKINKIKEYLTILHFRGKMVAKRGL